MKLAILSCSPNCYSTRRLREAALQRDHKVKVLNTMRFAIDLEYHGTAKRPAVWRRVSAFDAHDSR